MIEVIEFYSTDELRLLAQHRDQLSAIYPAQLSSLRNDEL